MVHTLLVTPSVTLIAEIKHDSVMLQTSYWLVLCKISVRDVTQEERESVENLSTCVLLPGRTKHGRHMLPPSP